MSVSPHINSPHSTSTSFAMQLLARFPRLPFSVAFDILFTHGGFTAFERIHGSTEEALYQFWRIYFVSSPIGNLNPAIISQWVEVMCTCHVVQSLPHPAHAIYLLRPVSHEIPESVAAWAIAGGRGNQLPRPEILIRAMRVFIPKGHQPLLQREWFWVSDVHHRRSLRKWLRFADDVIANHAFTRYWWMGQREGPFYLLGNGRLNTTDQVIANLAQRETLCMKKRLKRDETAKMVKQVQRARARKEMKDAEQKGQTIIPHSKKSTPVQPPTIVQRQHPTLSATNKEEIERLTKLRYSEYTSALSQAKSALSSMLVVTLDKHFRGVLCLVVSLGYSYPLIKWSIKLALHKVAVETGRSNWDIERELYRVMYRKDSDALKKLTQLSAVGKKK